MMTYKDGLENIFYKFEMIKTNNEKFRNESFKRYDGIKMNDRHHRVMVSWFEDSKNILVDEIEIREE